MNTNKFAFLGLLIFLGFNSYGQTNSKVTEKELISQTLMYYIDGTANGEPDKLKKAFHPDFNLYSVNNENGLKIWKGTDYLSKIKKGEKTNRVGKIISIDYEQNVASAKVEIEIPDWRVFTDYFLLVKYEGSWKIVHKSYTSKALSK